MEKNYECKDCGKKISVSDDTIPKCCGKPMKQIPLNFCTKPAHAEHTRPMENEGPCDDGRAG